MHPKNRGNAQIVMHPEIVALSFIYKYPIYGILVTKTGLTRL